MKPNFLDKMNNTMNLNSQIESTFSWLPRHVTGTTESTTFPGWEVTDNHNVPNETALEDTSIHNSTDSTIPWLQRTEEVEMSMNDTKTELFYAIREDTEVEMILNTVFTAVFLITILTANILLLIVMWRYKRLQHCNRLIRTMTAIFDIILSIAVAIVITSMSVFKYLSPNLFCLLTSKVIAFCLGVLINLNGVLAIERYVYIVHPMQYLVWVTQTRIILSILAIMASPLIFITVNLIRGSADIHSASFLCVNDNTPVYYFIFIVLPGVVITGISVINLYLFLRKSSENSAEAVDATKAIKLTFLLSGAIFTTYFPAFIIRMAIVQVWSWEELDAGVNIPAFIAVRCASFIISLGSSACNPVIQFYVEKDLWVGLRKIMGQKAYFSDQLDALEAANSRK